MHVAGQGFLYRLRDGWLLDVMYRYNRTELDATGRFEGSSTLYPVLSATPATTVVEEAVGWHDSLHTVDVRTTIMPSANLTIQPGLRFTGRDVQRRIDGVIDPSASQTQHVTRPEVVIGYRALSTLTLRGSYKSAYGDAAYTRLSPLERHGVRALVRFEPVSTVSVEGDITATNAERVEAGFRSRTRSYGARVSYAPTENYSVFGGYDRRSFSASGNGTFLRGTAPITGLLLLDREVNKVWQGGGVLRPVPRLVVTLTANYSRTTGYDMIAGEPPLYGPTTFPYGIVSVSYEVPRAGRVTLDLQRTYLKQEILSMNDFGATLATIRYSRSF
jgi:hypothetical protein